MNKAELKAVKLQLLLGEPVPREKLIEMADLLDELLVYDPTYDWSKRFVAECVDTLNGAGEDDEDFA